MVFRFQLENYFVVEPGLFQERTKSHENAVLSTPRVDAILNAFWETLRGMVFGSFRVVLYEGNSVFAEA